jgi:hemolysin III
MRKNSMPSNPNTQPAPDDERAQSMGEEIANAVSHGLGLLAILAATPFLMAAAWHRGAVGSILGAAFFAGSAALLYLASTLYHAVPAHRKDFFRMLDHLAIFFLIAGTYTPFALGPLRGSLGWTIFAVAWLLAFVGVLFKVFARFRYPYVSTAMYIAMGWLAVFMIRPLAAHLPVSALLWLVAGGLAYTAGVLFYHWERMRYSHLVWHLFVLAGTACHFVAILRYAP